MKVLIAGGAGFVGSHIAEVFDAAGHHVTVLDGLLDETGGSVENLKHLPSVQLIQSSVEDCSNLKELLDGAELLIDCMGWTRHMLALENPSYDLKLNVESHLYLIEALKGSSCRKVIWLGSRGQYGRLSVESATEEHPQNPADVQGIHKTAGESHWRVASKLQKIDVASVLFGNTFGPRQPMEGTDIGLVASFTRSLMNGEEVEIYGKGRMRDVVFAPDLAIALVQLASSQWEGFQPYNLTGSHITLETLVGDLSQACGSGSYVCKEFPDEVRQIDMGSSSLCDDKLCTLIGSYPKTSLFEALVQTIDSLN